MADIALALLLFPLPLLALLAAAEGWLLGRLGRSYDWRAYWASLGDAVGRLGVNMLLRGGVAGAVFYAAWNWRIGTIHMDSAWHWGLLFLGQEFCYYWMHRADHRIRWFWLNHAVHHSPNTLTLAAAYRLGWSGRITGAAVFFAPLVWIGFPVRMVVAVLALNLLYQFWLHTELVGRLPRPLEFVFNTPAHHRVHHASNPECLDGNYGGVLIVFDRLFGTLRSAPADAPLRYGLTTPLHSYNPVRIALHAWVYLARDLVRVRSPGQALRLVFCPPGAHPRGPARTDPRPSAYPP